MKKFEFLEHTADIKFRAFGKNMEEVFENSALAISEIISRGQKIKSEKKKQIEVEGHDRESLLYNFIEELLYLTEAESFLVSKANITVSGNKLKAKLSGDSTLNYSNFDHIKSPTYHEMYFKETGNGWEAQVVVDV